MKNFYNEAYKNDVEVRTAWYYFCYHFLPICSKELKDNLQDDLLKKKEIIFKSVTTSDEALVHFFIILWMPKLKEESENDWESKSYTTGDQELKGRIDEYSLIYQTILQCKMRNEGALAASWNDVFWEEVEKRHQKCFEQGNKFVAGTSIHGVEHGTSIPLPGIDEDCLLPKLIEKHNITVAITETAEKPPEDDFNNVTGV
jgi:hypothetical protein